MKNATFLVLIYFLNLNLLFSQEENINNEDLKFYKELIKHFKKNSLNKDSIDWESFEKKVMGKAKISRDSAIIKALSLNGEEHSSYFKKEQQTSLYGQYKSKTLIESINNIGYIKINSFRASRNSLKETISKAKIYINKRIETIKSQDKDNLKGWVIDLRNNSGGDMWPMIISLTPFLKDGVLGYTIKNEKENIWKKENDLIYYKSINKTKKYLGKDKSLGYNLKNENLKIAILVNERTSSSGEATAIALMNNQNVKFFGTKSFGYTTNNTSIEMKNGDFLVLTTGIWKNFKREEFKTGIIPDFESANEQELKKNIENWINK